MGNEPLRRKAELACGMARVGWTVSRNRAVTERPANAIRSPPPMKSLPFPLPLAALILVAVALAGCAATPVSQRSAWTANRETRPVVTPFWNEFPPTAKGLWVIPNQTLPRNTPVRFLGNRRGFARVQMESLEMGWVPRGTLKRN